MIMQFSHKFHHNLIIINLLLIFIGKIQNKYLWNLGRVFTWKSTALTTPLCVRQWQHEVQWGFYYTHTLFPHCSYLNPDYTLLFMQEKLIKNGNELHSHEASLNLDLSRLNHIPQPETTILVDKRIGTFISWLKCK